MSKLLAYIFLDLQLTYQKILVLNWLTNDSNKLKKYNSKIFAKLYQRKNRMKIILFALIFLTFSGCASMNDSMTPSISIIKDDFDGISIIRQSPVSSSSSLSEGWHTLGFEWSQKNPEIVFITAGTNGTTNIEMVAFNADGMIIDHITTASSHTEYGSWSTRRFSMPYDDFIKIANANSVKMKVTQLNDYSVSSFGPAHSGAIVNTKFLPFINTVNKIKFGTQN